MTTTLMPLVKQQFNQNGVPLVGGKLFVYNAGTTTKATSYTDSTGNTPNTNPIILDSNGQCSCWLDPTKFYKFILSPATDTDPPTNPFWTVDNVASPAPVAVGNMTDEKGGDGNPGFKAGTDFTPGTTSTLTLANTYGSASNLWVSFDAAEQGADSYSLDGNTLTFDAPIPSGTNKVYVKGGTSLTIGTPSDGTVTDRKLSPGSVAYIITENTWTLKRFGCKVDGVTDDTANVIKAVQSGEKLIFGDAGTCVISGTIEVNVDNFRMVGAGKHQTKFMMQSANLPAFNVATGLTGVELISFMIDRAVAATSGGDGIDWISSNSQGLLSDILVQNCWHAFSLGPTDYSKMIRCIAQQNYSGGIYMTNIGLGGPCQWSLDQCLSQNNNGIGLLIDASTGSSGAMSVGEITNFSTFGNTGKGIAAIGKVSNPINGLRILGGFIGGDADDEIYLDTYGGQHKIVGTEMELTGTSATGRGNATPPSNIGHGIAITPNNERTQISDPNINGCSLTGIASFGSVTSISNPHITNNGIAAVASDQNGVLVGAGRTMIVGGYIADTGQGAQKFGLSAGAGTVVHVTGTDMTGNVTSPTTGAGTIVTSNCLP